MTIRRVISIRPVSILLAVVFLIAQTGLLAHAYEHDAASPQDQICSTCIVGQALGSVCVDSTPHFGAPPHKSATGPEQVSARKCIHVPLARQRAPPTPL